MIAAAVFLAQLSGLLFEILLTRVFAITQWHHLAFMVISIAMLGTSAGGVLAMVRSGRIDPARAIGPALVLLSLSVPASLQVLRVLPIDYFQIYLDPRQAVYLVATFAALSVPFFCSGLVAALAYSLHPERAGLLYLAALGGSGIGTLLAPILVPLVGLQGSLLVAALAPLPGVFLGRGAADRLLGGVASLLVVGGLYLAPQLLVFQPNAYKPYSQYSQMPDLTVEERSHTLRSRLDRISSPYIRRAPGLSLKFRGSLPSQQLVVEDGAVTHVLFEGGSFDHTAGTLLRAAYEVYEAPPESVVILQNEGGHGVATALAAGAERVQLVLADERIAETYRRLYTGKPALEVTAGPARGFLRRGEPGVDMVHYEDWGPDITGMASLALVPGLTVEATRAMLDALKPQGILVLARTIHVPPNDFVRTLRTVWAALEQRRPQDHTLILRSWDSYVLLASREPFDGASVERVRRFAQRLNFDLVHYPGIQQSETNRHNIMESSLFFEAVRSEIRGLEDRLYDTSPRSDDRPYPYAFLSPGKLQVLAQVMNERVFALLIAGETLVVIVFACALLLSALVLGLPPVLMRSRGPSGLLLLVAALGAGFMLAELGWLGTLTLVLGNPTAAFTVAVGGLLLFSGIGGWVSAAVVGSRVRDLVLAAPAAAALALYVFAAPLRTLLLGMRPAGQVGLALLVLAAQGFLMGIPFPTMIRFLLPRPADRAYAWAVNGAVSVLTAIAAMQVSLAVGHKALFLSAAVCYGVVALGLRRRLSTYAGAGGGRLPW